MFSRSEKKLSFLKIAKYWSQEIQPPASPDELVETMEAAWWRGEIVGTMKRLQLLRSMFSSRESPSLRGIVFVTQDDPETPAIAKLPNGDVLVEVNMLPRISVPSLEPDLWTEESCDRAFETLAESPSETHFPPLSVALHLNELTYEEFFRWVDARGFDVPEFWKRNSAANVPEYRTGAPGRPSSSQFVEAELDRRAASGIRSSNATKEAESLADWLKTTHPLQPPMTAKTILNKFRNKIRDHVNARN